MGAGELSSPASSKVESLQHLINQRNMEVHGAYAHTNTHTERAGGAPVVPKGWDGVGNHSDPLDPLAFMIAWTFLDDKSREWSTHQME